MQILRAGAALAFAIAIATQAMAQPMDPAMGTAEEHRSHPAPEHLGAVTFPTSCKPGVW